MSEHDIPLRPLAVALDYAYGDKGTPRVVAKGRGLFAERIRETALAHGVHVEENPALAEALAAVEIDEEIPDALFEAVAAIISYVLRASGASAGNGSSHAGVADLTPENVS